MRSKKALRVRRAPSTLTEEMVTGRVVFVSTWIRSIKYKRKVSHSKGTMETAVPIRPIVFGVSHTAYISSH